MGLHKTCHVILRSGNILSSDTEHQITYGIPKFLHLDGVELNYAPPLDAFIFLKLYLDYTVITLSNGTSYLRSILVLRLEIVHSAIS